MSGDEWLGPSVYCRQSSDVESKKYHLSEGKRKRKKTVIINKMLQNIIIFAIYELIIYVGLGKSQNKYSFNGHAIKALPLPRP